MFCSHNKDTITYLKILTQMQKSSCTANIFLNKWIKLFNSYRHKVLKMTIFCLKVFTHNLLELMIMCQSNLTKRAWFILWNLLNTKPPISFGLWIDFQSLKTQKRLVLALEFHQNLHKRESAFLFWHFKCTHCVNRYKFENKTDKSCFPCKRQKFCPRFFNFWSNFLLRSN